MAGSSDLPWPIRPQPIGVVRSSIRDLAEAPSQASESGGPGRVVIDDSYVPGLLGLERYSHLWLLTWLGSGAERPVELQLVPRATEATGTIQGVFASRAPRRPTPIGLSLVRQTGISGNEILLAGIDLLDGTPVLDIKPWFADCDLPSALESG